jgi:hypothetical protein
LVQADAEKKHTDEHAARMQAILLKRGAPAEAPLALTTPARIELVSTTRKNPSSFGFEAVLLRTPT